MAAIRLTGTHSWPTSDWSLANCIAGRSLVVRGLSTAIVWEIALLPFGVSYL